MRALGSAMIAVGVVAREEVGCLGVLHAAVIAVNVGRDRGGAPRGRRDGGRVVAAFLVRQTEGQPGGAREEDGSGDDPYDEATSDPGRVGRRVGMAGILSERRVGGGGSGFFVHGEVFVEGVCGCVGHTSL